MIKDRLDYFTRMNKWKSVNPNIKIIFSVGGWDEGTKLELSIWRKYKTIKY